ncbi:MAG: YdiU family protein [Rhodobacter sp.]|nr:YdiU family protein [Rhodobacter sp.]
MTIQIPFDNSYAELPERFYARLDPTPVAEPALIALNDALARDLGLDADALKSPAGVQVLAGNMVPPGADPLAQAYAGHQFGGWSPQLGDGRAILLGEVISANGLRHDIQLKGSGRTPFSRMGDGRAWLGPVIREYIVSEAMHALGIPTTRALAAVATGETVLRETPLPGAVLTRVASSHIRVGTFQYFAARQDKDALKELTDHVIARHYPDAGTALEMLERVIAAQARLVAQWMGVGFIHGVMNTDNTHIAGETIDYGPCAFMDRYHPETVYSSIDQFGRYAYARQPEIAVWNLAQLATALLPLIDEDQDRAIEMATEAVHRFPGLYSEAWLAVFRPKLGLTTAEPGDAQLIETLLSRMSALGADFTNTFRGLADGSARGRFADPDGFDAWAADWRARMGRETADEAVRIETMRRANPAVIPRNHRVEEAISAAVAGDFGPFRALMGALVRPWDDPSGEGVRFTRPPEPGQEVRQTFCGT